MINKEKLFESLPPADSTFSYPSIPQNQDYCIVVLDDDPTGTQTSHGVPVITKWNEAIINESLQLPIFFVLTNSRSLSGNEAYQCVFDLCILIFSEAKKLDRKVVVISRTDSTLRGHFKLEFKAIEKAKGQPLKRIFIPAFIEGGRYTIHDQHFVQEGEKLINASDTPFAKDQSFGYSTSFLPDYIKEKDADALGISSISIEDLRTKAVQSIVDRVVSTKDQYVFFNAASHADLNKVGFILQSALSKGYEFSIRSAAGIIPALAGIQPTQLLNGIGIKSGKNGGLIVVGSYVPKSTSQLNHLLENHQPVAIEVDVNKLLTESAIDYVAEIGSQLNHHIAAGEHCLIYTSRLLVADNDPVESLKIVNQVSNGILAIVQKIKEKPSFIIAKGGITSSDVATKALGIERAEVLGQLLPGVPVWKCGSEAKYPELPYVIFPGNVGTEESLSEAYQKITQT